MEARTEGTDMAIARLIVALVLGVGIFLAAVIAIQNVEPVTLTFLGFQSIKMPFGVMLVGGVAMGLIGGAAVNVAWQVLAPQPNPQPKRSPQTPYVRGSRPRQ